MLRALATIFLASAILYFRYLAMPPIIAELPFTRDAIMLLLIPLLLLPLLGMKPKDAGLSLGGTKNQLKNVTFVLILSTPLLFFAATLPEFNTYYPLFGWARDSPLNLITYEIFILCLMLATEFFFRGFIMMGTAKLGKNAALLLQNIPYTLVHVWKPFLELPASFFAGLIFGKMDQDAKSILPSLLLHWCINLIIDAFCIYFYFAQTKIA